MITGRLLPGLQIGKATISIEYADKTQDDRQAYRWYIDLPEEEFTNDDLASGFGGGTLQEGLESLLSFLGAFAEGWRNSDDFHRCENCDLFPIGLRNWAIENADEFPVMENWLEEHPSLINE